MPTIHYQFYQCENPACSLRFPGLEGSLSSGRCPRCKHTIKPIVTIELDQEAPIRSEQDQGFMVAALLDNIRSAWNVGSMFRTADGTGIERLYLCGITPTPEHKQVGKTALGSEKRIPWEYASNGVNKTKSLIEQGCQVWGLEDVPGSVNLFDIKEFPVDATIILVAGNEVCGIDPGILELCNRIVAIPMQGVKRSYNVAVAFGIAAICLRYCHIFSQGSLRILPNT